MATPSGMAFFLKSLGIDPEQITKTVAEMGQIMLAAKQALDRIEARQDALEKLLREITEK